MKWKRQNGCVKCASILPTAIDSKMETVSVLRGRLTAATELTVALMQCKGLWSAASGTELNWPEGDGLGGGVGFYFICVFSAVPNITTLPGFDNFSPVEELL